jgi:hypothetical protein
MIHSRFLGACFICLFIAACDTQKQSTAVKTTAEIKTAPEIKTSPEKTAPEKIAHEKAAKQQITTIKVRPEISLSINNMHIDHHIKARPVINLSVDNMYNDPNINNNNFMNTGKKPTEKHNALFKTLSKNDMESRINLSGKLLTDEDKVQNKEYIESVNGVQINIQGTFN